MELIRELNNFSQKNPFGLVSPEEDNYFLSLMKYAFLHHIKSCEKFKNWCEYFGINEKNILAVKTIEELPFLPSSAFKKNILISATEGTHGKSLLSSGTSSNKKSTIYIDNITSNLQKSTLANMLSNIIGTKRMECFIFDNNPINLRVDNELSGRVAGMAGYLLAAKSRNYFLESESLTNISGNTVDKLQSLKDKKDPVYLIGYTFMLYSILKSLSEKNIYFELPKNSKLIHFGGWKKMEDSKVSKKTLNELIVKVLNIKLDNIYDIYGFTEQLGTIYPASGNKGTAIPIQTRVIVRDTNTFKPLKKGSGFLQFLNPFPYSYPGISILQDDIGSYCHKTGLINIEGRIKGLDERGCGDTIDYDARI